MTKEQVIEILEEYLVITDEWGGSKLADWKWGCNVVLGGLDETAEAILEAASPPTDEADAGIRDILILVGRLSGEDPLTFAPETAEVMNRWKPRFKAMLENA